jgi:hypothetical protein
VWERADLIEQSIPRMMTRGFAIAGFLICACDRTSTPEPHSSESRDQLVAADPPAGRGATSPNVVSTARGVLLTWLEPRDDKSHRLRFARSAGAGWSAATTIAEGSNIVANWADVPSLVEQQDGVLVAHWAEKISQSAPHAYNVVLARSTDAGVTWNRLGSPHGDGTATEHGFVSLVPATSSVLAIWLDGRETAKGNGPTMLRAARIDGEKIGDEQIVDERVCDCCSTAAANTSSGPVVVFRDRSSDEVRDPWIARLADGNWSTSRAVNVDGWTIAGCPVNGPAIAARGRDVAVAWYTLANQRPTVRLAFSGDAGATFEPAIEIDVPLGARAPIGRVDVALDGSDAIVSWMVAERDVGRLLVRRVTRQRRMGPELELTTLSADRSSGFPRLELAGDDLWLVWTDSQARTLRARRIARTALK